MHPVRLIANLLFYVSRLLAILIAIVALYALIIILLHQAAPSASLPIQVTADGSFRIYYPFTTSVLLLGDYSTGYLFSNFFAIAFYGAFLWLLGDVFKTFRQPRLFTPMGVARLSRFYITNLTVPLVLVSIYALSGEPFSNMLHIILLHAVIGVFAFFMAAIFRQGLNLQEEQDLTL
jgi:hypothetical protein